MKIKTFINKFKLQNDTFLQRCLQDNQALKDAKDTKTYFRKIFLDEPKLSETARCLLAKHPMLVVEKLNQSHVYAHELLQSLATKCYTDDDYQTRNVYYQHTENGMFKFDDWQFANHYGDGRQRIEYITVDQNQLQKLDLSLVFELLAQKDDQYQIYRHVNEPMMIVIEIK